jgi:four helix bundle protein
LEAWGDIILSRKSEVESVDGAQYREARRAKSTADFISKTEGALQEVDEAGYWLELIQDSGVSGNGALAPLRAEARQLLAIFVAITRKAKQARLRSRPA